MSNPPPTRAMSGFAESPARAAYGRHVPRWVSAAEGAVLGVVCWLALGPLCSFLLSTTFPALRGLVFGHWKLGKSFLVLLGLFYPLHLLSHGGFTRESLKHFARRIAPALAIILVLALVVLLSWSRLFVALKASVTERTTADYSGNAAWGTLLVVPLLLYYRISKVGIRRGVRGLVAPLLLGGFAMGVVAVTVYVGEEEPQHRFIHGVTAYVFVAGALYHAWGLRRALSPEGRAALAAGFVAAMIVAIGVDARRSIGIWKWDHARADPGSRSPRLVSQYSALQGYPSPPAGTDSNWFVEPSAHCGNRGCHESIAYQLKISAHARSMDNAAFKVELAGFIEQRGRAAADHCLACHAPLGVIAFPADGTVEIDPLTTREPAFEAGVGCLVCHRARSTTPPGEEKNASVAVRPLWLEESWPLFRLMPLEEFVYSNLKYHRAAFHIDNASPICGACHVVTLPAPLSADGKERATIDQYTSFRESPYYSKTSCTSCHQQRFVTTDYYGQGRTYPAPGHAYLGSGSSLPYDDPTEDAKFRDISLGYLTGLGDIGLDIQPDALPPCLDTIEQANDPGRLFERVERDPAHPFAGMNGGVTRRDLLLTKVAIVSLDAGSARLSVETTNSCIGHAFPSGEGIKGYLEVEAYDERGRVVGRYGGLAADGLPIDAPTNLGVKAVDAEGKVITNRHYWNAVKITYRRVINPAETATDVVEVPLAPGARPARFEARWKYLRPEYFRSRERGLNTDVPAVVLGSATLDVSSEVHVERSSRSVDPKARAVL